MDSGLPSPTHSEDSFAPILDTADSIRRFILTIRFVSRSKGSPGNDPVEASFSVEEFVLLCSHGIIGVDPYSPQFRHDSLRCSYR